jgi:alpha-1,2-mannosyltransferase
MTALHPEPAVLHPERAPMRPSFQRELTALLADPVAWHRRRRRWARTAAAMSFAAVLGLSLYLAVSGHQVDFDVYLMGASHAFDANLYQVQLGNSGLLFTYAPAAALLFVPFADLFTLIPAQAVWTVLNVGALIWLLGTSIRSARPDLSATTVRRWSLILSFPAMLLDPVFLTIGLGQVNLFLIALVLWDLVVPRTFGKRLPVGVATGLAAAVKLTPLIFVLYLVATRRFRAAATCVATFVACETLALVASPAASWTYWTKDVLDPNRAGGLLYISDQNLSSALQRFHHGPVSAAVLWPLLMFVGIGGIAVAAWAQRRSSEMLGVLACGSTSLLVSPVTWAHHMVWIVPVIVWAALAADRPRRGVALAAGATILFWASPLWWVPRSWRLPGRLELHEDWWQLIAGNSFFIATVLFLAGVTFILATRTWGSGARPVAPAEPG